MHLYPMLDTEPLWLYVPDRFKLKRSGEFFRKPDSHNGARRRFRPIAEDHRSID
jgi:hypothetical protein